MARYIIETKQLSGQWLTSGVKEEKATSRQSAMDKASVEYAKYRVQKRAVDTKTGEVLVVVGEEPTYPQATELVELLCERKVEGTGIELFVMTVPADVASMFPVKSKWRRPLGSTRGSMFRVVGQRPAAKEQA